jgi:hypothetical protein
VGVFYYQQRFPKIKKIKFPKIFGNLYDFKLKISYMTYDLIVQFLSKSPPRHMLKFKFRNEFDFKSKKYVHFYNKVFLQRVNF